MIKRVKKMYRQVCELLVCSFGNQRQKGAGEATFRQSYNLMHQKLSFPEKRGADEGREPR